MSSDRPDTSVATSAGPRARFKVWLAVVVLMLVGVLNYVDRLLPSVLAEPIKRDLQLSDTMLGLINGFGFLLIYAILGIPLARVADRGRYGLVIGACLALWGAMTMVGGYVRTGWELAATRMGVAVGEAGSTPAAHAYISRNFEPHLRGVPLALLTISGPLAQIAALMAGGLIAEAIGWRGAFVVIGAVSVAIVPLVFLTLGIGKRVAPLAEAARTEAPARAWLLVKKRSYLLIVAAAGVASIAGYTMNAFVPAFLMRVHHMSVGSVGVMYGLANGLSGILSLAITGLLVDRFSRKDPRAPLWLMLALVAMFAPCAVVGLITSHQTAAVVLMGAAFIPVGAYLVPSVAAIQRLAPENLRATASAIMLCSSGLIGGIGPLLAGMISDALKPELGDRSLAQALFIVPVALATAGGLYYAASRFMRGELVEEG
jgi:MFS family permease